MYFNRRNYERYIGQTRRVLEQRDYEHHTADSGMDIDIALQEHPEDFELSVIGWYPVDELDYWEKYWIAYYDTFEGYGYNNTPGGSIADAAEASKVKVVAINPRTGETAVFDSMVELAEAIKEARGMSTKLTTISSTISHVCGGRRYDKSPRSTRYKTSGTRKSAYGLIFAYLEDFEANPEKYLSRRRCAHSRTPRSVRAVHIETNDEFTFRSITAAADWITEDSDYNYKGLCSETVRNGITAAMNRSNNQYYGFSFYSV